MKKTILAAIVLSLFSITIMAQNRTPNATKRQANQQQRINQGVNSGELTPAETRKLEQQQTKVQQTKKSAKADGVVTAKERAKIHRQQNNASQSIKNQKNDEQKR